MKLELKKNISFLSFFIKFWRSNKDYLYGIYVLLFLFTFSSLLTAPLEQRLKTRNFEISNNVDLFPGGQLSDVLEH